MMSREEVLNHARDLSEHMLRDSRGPRPAPQRVFSHALLRQVLQRRDVGLSQKLGKIAPRHRQHRRHRVDLLLTPPNIKSP